MDRSCNWTDLGLKAVNLGPSFSHGELPPMPSLSEEVEQETPVSRRTLREIVSSFWVRLFH